jgi:phosphoadenosine phosphosulfate reductase
MTTEITNESASLKSSQLPLPLAEFHPDPGDLDELSDRFEGAHPREILAWAFEYIPDLAIGTSFQLGGLINIFLAREVVAPVKVLFLETGFHFPETLEFRDRLVDEWGLDMINTVPTLGPERQAKEIHPELYKVDPDQCCYLNKVLPMESALEGLGGWATGVRRDQSPTRANTRIFEIQQLTSGKVIWKVNPQAHWTRAQVEEFSRQHNLPSHPLYDAGYLSIGCWPCTRKVAGDDEDERAGRWDGFDKAECGIHTNGNGTGDAKALPIRIRARA